MIGQNVFASTKSAKTKKGWMITFADLMTLLLCFFVLLFSFSSLDNQKFQALTQSFQNTFSTGKYAVTPQKATGNSAVQLHEGDSILKEKTKNSEKLFSSPTKNEQESEVAQKLRRLLSDEISHNLVSVSGEGEQVVIRLEEGAAFAAGSGFLQPQFEPIIEKIAQFLVNIPGQITVAGHTDSAPIANEMFKNNSELSVARAMSVANILSQQSLYSDVVISGYGASMPLGEEDPNGNDLRNRRVEIWVVQGKENIKSLPKLDKGVNR